MIKELLKEYINNNLEQEPLKSRIFKIDKILDECYLESEHSLKRMSSNIKEYI